SYGGSPIFASVTHDGGATWSAPVEISGSAPFCIGVFGDTTCDQNQGSVPAVAANGAIYVAFLSTRETTTITDQYLGVQVDAAPAAREERGDRVMPWASYGAVGCFRVGDFERSYDRANH